MLCENCDTYDDGEGIVQFCPLHESAGELLKTLDDLDGLFLDILSEFEGKDSVTLQMERVREWFQMTQEAINLVHKV